MNDAKEFFLRNLIYLHNDKTIFHFVYPPTCKHLEPENLEPDTNIQLRYCAIYSVFDKHWLTDEV